MPQSEGLFGSLIRKSGIATFSNNVSGLFQSPTPNPNGPNHGHPPHLPQPPHAAREPHPSFNKSTPVRLAASQENLSQAPSPSRHPASKYYTRSTPRLLQGTYGDEILISDDEAEAFRDRSRQIPQVGQSTVAVTTKKPSHNERAPPKHLTLISKQRASEKQAVEGTRAGSHKPTEEQAFHRTTNTQATAPLRPNKLTEQSVDRNSFADDIRIVVPMGDGYQNSKLKPQGLRPVDTFNRQPPSSQAQWRHEKTRGIPYTREKPKSNWTSGSASTQRATTVRDNDHGLPRKRRRTGPSPTDEGTKVEFMETDDHQDRDGIATSLKTVEADASPRPTHSTPQAAVDPMNFYAPVTFQRDRPAASEGEKRKKGRSFQNTDVDSFRPLDDESTDPSEFTRAATLQRRAEEPRRNTSLRSLYGWSEETEAASGSHATTFEHGQVHLPNSPRPRRRPIVQTPATSRIAKRLNEGSPDELHSTVTTHASDYVLSQKRPRQRRISDSDPIQNVLSRANKESVQDHDYAMSRTKFELQDALVPGLEPSSEYVLELDPMAKTFSITYASRRLSEEAVVADKSLSKILRMEYSPDGECAILSMHVTSGVFINNSCLFEFQSPRKLVEFVNTVQKYESHVQLRHRTTERMQKMRVYAYSLKNSSVVKKPLDDADGPGFRPPSKEEPDPAGQESTRKTAQPFKPQDSTTATLIPVASSPGSKPDLLSKTISKPVDNEPSKTEPGVPCVDADPSATKLSRSRRQTRARAVRSPSHGRGTTVSNPSASSSGAKHRRRGLAWKQPLLYPPDEKRQATVDESDLSRLDDDEFLNDTLVGLFLRYLERNTEHEVRRKMHFFNSFLFDTLCRTKDGKNGRKQINYQGVANWTKGIRLFNRDFVVVPVNENCHWYAMVICNLSYFLEKKSQMQEYGTGHGEKRPEGADDAVTIDGFLDVKPPDAETACESFEDLSLDDQGRAAVTANTAREKGGRRKKKPPRFPGKKYDTTKPVIITLDSLNIPHSATASVLKMYIVEEAKKREDIDIDASEITGMTAKGIPLQSNFSDCGMYLCMYIEQFMRDPYNFVRKILQREEHGLQWPEKIESSELRQRFCDMLEELHAKQIGQKVDANIPEIGKILIDVSEPPEKGHPESVLNCDKDTRAEAIPSSTKDTETMPLDLGKDLTGEPERPIDDTKPEYASLTKQVKRHLATTRRPSPRKETAVDGPEEDFDADQARAQTNTESADAKQSSPNTRQVQRAIDGDEGERSVITTDGPQRHRDLMNTSRNVMGSERTSPLKTYGSARRATQHVSHWFGSPGQDEGSAKPVRNSSGTRASRRSDQDGARNPFAIQPAAKGMETKQAERNKVRAQPETTDLSSPTQEETRQLDLHSVEDARKNDGNDKSGHIASRPRFPFESPVKRTSRQTQVRVEAETSRQDLNLKPSKMNDKAGVGPTHRKRRQQQYPDWIKVRVPESEDDEDRGRLDVETARSNTPKKQQGLDGNPSTDAHVSGGRQRQRPDPTPSPEFPITIPDSQEETGFESHPRSRVRSQNVEAGGGDATDAEVQEDLRTGAHGRGSRTKGKKTTEREPSVQDPDTKAMVE